MKKVIAFVFLTFSILGYTSCKKQADSFKQENSLPADSTLQGDWELRTLIGCQVPGCNPIFQPGNGQIWKFSDSTFKFYVNHTLVDSGVLIQGTDSCLATNRVMNYFARKNDNNYYYYLDKLFFAFTNNQLVIYRGVVAADGTIEKYSRL